MSEPVEVAAAVVFNEGKVLIAQRHSCAHLGGLWEFPGGKRRPHETFEQCLVRELHEELGIEIEVGPLLESVTHQYPECTVHLHFYVCRWTGGEPKPLGCNTFRWVGPDELHNFEFPAADARLVELLQSRRRLWEQ